MNDDEPQDDGLYVAMHLETRLVRVLDNSLVPSRISIKADVNPDPDASEAALQGVLTKIKYWFEHLVTRSIAFSSDNEHAIEMFIDDEGKNRTSNMIMLTPGDPTDEMLAALFQCKMTALASGIVEFGFVEVRSDNMAGMSFTFIGEGTRVLPSNAEWMGERTFFDEPWWCRNDASTLDVVPAEDADLTKTPAWAFSLDALLKGHEDDEIIVRPQFRPTVINGGRDDEDE